MQYNSFKYIYPQLPKKSTSGKHLDNFDNGEYVLQPNYEGEVCTVFTNGFELMVYDHRGKILKNVSNTIDFRRMALSKNWFVYTGLYCNKYRNVEMAFEQDRFIITDVLVWDGEYLVGTTLLERLSLLDHAFKFNVTMISDCFVETFKFLYCTEIIGVFRARVYHSHFVSLFEQMNKAAYDGVVLRKKETQLQDSMRSRNNRQDNILCRNRISFFNF